MAFLTDATPAHEFGNMKDPLPSKCNDVAVVNVFFFGHETFAHGAACYAMRNEKRKGDTSQKEMDKRGILAGTDASSSHSVMKKA